MTLVRCGVDEAGRGCWAGPVVAAAVVFKGAVPEGLRDSKKLTKRQLAALYPVIQDCSWWAVGQASAQEIDEVNILQATFLAMRRAVAQLPQEAFQKIIVDGNQNPRFEALADGVMVLPLVDADATVPEVSAASIVAKVTRDALLAQLASRYPGYGFEKHVGYGVPEHISALEKLGPCPEHRMTFKPLRKWTGQPTAVL